MNYDLIVLGGGAAGIFGAVIAAGRGLSVCVLEKRAALLSKVKVSGGGRCNVTHACFDPKQFSTHYPRGAKELLSPLYRFGAEQTIAWFAERGVTLYAEEDGRMFPTTNHSQTVIDCLLHEAEILGVHIETEATIVALQPHFEITLPTRSVQAHSLLLATGSSPDGYRFAEQCGHTLIPPVPSLFTFNCPSSPLLSLSGVTVAEVSLSVAGERQQGPLLLTHFGFSGPAALKLSAWAARKLAALHYHAELTIDWLPGENEEQSYNALRTLKEKHPQRQLANTPLGYLPKRLWEVLAAEERPLNQLSDQCLRQLSHKLHHDTYLIEGKTTHKEEFVTCGGVCLKEVDFRRMESRYCPGLFFAGEILDIDGITGGFNFQNAWTTSWVVGQSI